MKIVPTRRSEYGLRALCYLVQREREQRPGIRVKAEELAATLDIPKGFLQQVLQAIHRAGIVSSRVSRAGGYALSRAPEEVSVLEVVEALEGPAAEQRCPLRGGVCPGDGSCVLNTACAAARQAFVDQLGALTLADVVDELDRGWETRRRLQSEHR